MERRRASRIAGDLDVNQARMMVLDRKESLLSMEKTYNSVSRRIRESAGIDSTMQIKPRFAPLNMVPDTDFEEVFDLLKEESRTFLLLKELEKSGATSVEIRKRNLMPSAALFAGFSHSGAGYIPGDETSRALSVGINISKAFPAEKDKALLETAEIDYMKTLLSNEIKEENLKRMLKAIHTDIKKTQELLELNREKLRIAELILRDTAREYETGRTALRSYTDAINSLETVRYRNLHYKARINMLIIEWLRITDSLVVKDNKHFSSLRVLIDEITE